MDDLASTRHRALRRIAAAALTATSLLAQAQDYPSKPISVVVPWPPGGVVDVAARQLGSRLQAALGQAVVIENKPGAGGNIGAGQVAKSPADGYTLLLTSSGLTINTALQPRLPYKLSQDFEPLALIAHAPSVLVVGPATTPASVKELVELARSKPGRLSYASAGVGSPAHLIGELFKSTQKIFVVHVPYTGAPAALNDQLAGHIDFQFANATVAVPQILAGKVKALAVTSGQRFASLPQVPTMAEAGVPDFEVDQWLGLLGPRGLPKAVSERLSAEVNKVLASAEFRQALARAGMNTSPPGTPAGFDAAIKQDLARWTTVVKTQGLKPE